MFSVCALGPTSKLQVSLRVKEVVQVSDVLTDMALLFK